MREMEVAEMEMMELEEAECLFDSTDAAVVTVTVAAIAFGLFMLC
jgi:hypothetical protein